MGEFTRPGSEIRYFQPDETETETYIEANYQDVNLTYILEVAKIKWPNCHIKELSIRAEHIHTDCLGYDRYDAGDHTNFLKVTYTKVDGGICEHCNEPNMAHMGGPDCGAIAERLKKGQS